MRIIYWQKNPFWAIFGKNSTFLTFFKKDPFSTFLNFFRNFNHETHILIGNKVKLYADSEFLVHFYVGHHFRGFCPC
jgi:hypothetical protein